MALPALSPDYSGVASMFYEMGALVVMHDATGCIGNYTAHDEPRQGCMEHMVFTTNIRENDVVMGTDDILLEKTLNAVEYMDPRMIVLVGTPIPALIGTDLKALAGIIEKKTGRPCFAFNTNGLKLYDKGIEAACLAQCERLAEEYAAFEQADIAVIGASPINLGPLKNAESLRTYCSLPGLVTCVVGIGAGETSVGAASRSRLNIAACSAAIPTCEYLREKYGTPFFADLPVGKSGVERVRGKISRILGIRQYISGENSCSEQNAHIGEGKSALVIHEQLTANAVRACLREEFGFATVEVASFFDLRSELCEAGDRKIGDEAELEELAAGSSYDFIFCDMLLWPAMRGCGAWLIGLPHLAVSSVWRLKDHPRLFGEDFSRFLIAGITSRPE